SDLVELRLVWRINETPSESPRVFLRWQNGKSIFPAGRLPANDYLPFNGAEAGQTIQDFYQIPLTTSELSGWDGAIPLEIALALPFTPSDQIAWEEVAALPIITGVFTAQEHPQTHVRILTTDRWNNNIALSGQGLQSLYLPDQIKSGEELNFPEYFPYLVTADTAYNIFIASAQDVPPLGEQKLLRCGWLQWPTNSCFVRTIPTEGVAISEDAINFGNQIALIDYATNSKVRPGGGIELDVTWQGLRQIDEDYTIFVQVLNQDDQLVGQLDIKPAQGTRPTNLWEPGELLQDRFTVPLTSDLSTADTHRLIIGFYRLSDFQRLLVLDSDGTPTGDHFVIPLENE
ncbi:MAG: hypothetical protein AAF902_09795, partial [Chloroflexota bacterium]